MEETEPHQSFTNVESLFLQLYRPRPVVIARVCSSILVTVGATLLLFQVRLLRLGWFGKAGAPDGVWDTGVKGGLLTVFSPAFLLLTPQWWE